MAILVRNKTLLAKRESNYGSDPTPTVGSNALEARNVKVTYSPELLERDNIRGNISAVQPVVGKRWAEATFELELKGGGTKGTAARVGDLLVACGFSETASAGSSVVYLPASDSLSSVALYIYEHVSASSSRLHKILGARGNVTIKMTAGQFATLSFAFKGKYAEPTDVAHPGAATYETTLPPIVNSAAFTLNAVDSLVVQEVNMDLANQIIEEEDISDATSLKGFLLTGRKPSGSFNPEAVAVATYNFFADWVAATARALSIVIGSASGNKCTITAPKVTIDSISEGDRNGIRTEEIPFKMSQNSGNDEIQLKFE